MLKSLEFKIERNTNKKIMIMLQAPESLKSVVQAMWLSTTALGDLVVIIIANIHAIPSQVTHMPGVLSVCLKFFLKILYL